MSYHRQRSMPHARGYRIRSKSRLPRKRVPSVKFHSSTKSRRPPHRENSIRYPLQVEDEIKFYETEHRRFLAQVEIRNLTPFAMIYKLFHSNPALEPTEFTISSSYGFVQFDEVLSILIAPARYLSPEYMEEAIFELWIAPKAIYPWEKGRDIGSNWPKYVKDHVIMKKVMNTVVRDSQQYIEELLMRGVQYHGYDSESIISSVPSLSLYAARAKQREAKRLKMAKENPNGAANSNDLSSSRAVRHFVKQLMEKQQEQAKLRYDAKLMKRKRPPKPQPLSQSEPNRDETLTIYQRDLLTRNQSRTSWTWILYCFLMFAGVLFLLGLFYLVAQKAYRVLFPNWHKNEKNSRVFFSDYVIQ